ncbi:MAG: hypothetical protein QOD95_1764 [Gammaproteobacteria bacterium]|jgi:hypothetical protein|nr:hypothetical protein [Gammaproteobacteria bacterium]
MTIEDPELLELLVHTTGTVDDDDDPADENPSENEAPIRETNEATEAPEEFEVDHEDELGRPEDDEADEGDPDEDGA